MRITKIDIKILVDLYKSVDGLSPYTFYQRYQLSPATIFKSASKFIRKEYILDEKEKFVLTLLGRKFIEKNKFKFSKNKFERIPNEFKVPKLEINEPYLPNITKLLKSRNIK